MAQNTNSSKASKAKSNDNALWKRRALMWSLRIGAGLLVGFFLLVFFVYIGLFGKIPSVEDLKKIDNHSASLVYSVDGKIMGGYYLENRQTIGNKDISPYVKDALIATEDSRFFEHKGLDFISLGRVIVKTIFLGDKAQGGGSTISQQLAKNLYPRKKLGPLSLLVNKIREAFIASRLEKSFNKEEILTMYLNTVPFGEDVYGIEAASQRFFQKRSRFLNPAESATLVGMLAANTAYNPRLNPEKSQTRRNTVLKRMLDQGFITQDEYGQWRNLPVRIDYNRIDQNTGISPYFRERIRIRVEEILADKYGSEYDIHTDGLKIYTTIDSRLQSYADAAMARQMAVLQKEFDKHWEKKEPWASQPQILKSAIRNSRRYQSLKEQGLSESEIQKEMARPVRMNVLTADGEKVVTMSPVDSVKHYLKIMNVGFVAMDSRSGYILAWVGGVSHKAFQFDHVTSRRQVGSTFKPFVYATALLNGLEPCNFIANERKVYDNYNDWSPGNSNNEYGGYYSLKGGLANSVNTVAAELIMKTGPDAVVDLAEAMGIESSIPAYPSIALGTADLSLYEMVRAYAPFVNGGYKIEPVGLLKIEDSHGKVLYQYKPSGEKEQVIDPEVAQMMVEMMKGVIEQGTGKSLRSVYGLMGDVAGKTGTTQDNTDGWFIGCTPGMVAGAWVGNDVPSIRFRSTALGQGAHTAMPIYGMFVNRVERDPRFQKYAGGYFPALPDYLTGKFDCEYYSLNDPNGGFFDRLFDKPHKVETPKEMNEGKSDASRSDKDKQSLLDRMRDIFKKK
ncbi:MAG: transglycosylase domain-containing protein [Breznakibacter sp.]